MILQQNTNRAAEADSKVKRKNHEQILLGKFLVLLILKLHIFREKENLLERINIFIENLLMI